MFEEMTKKVQESMTVYVDSIIARNELRTLIYDYDANPSQKLRDALGRADWEMVWCQIGYSNAVWFAMRDIGDLNCYWFFDICCYFDNLVDDIIGDYYFGE